MTALVLVVGHDRAGKSTVAGLISAHLGIPVLELGDEVRRRQAVDPSLPRNVSEAYMRLRDRAGPRLVAQWIRAHAARILLVVGLRDFASFNTLKTSSSRLICIYVSSGQECRFARPRRADMTRRDLAAAEALHSAWGIEEVIAEASLTVVNDGDLSELYNRTNAVAMPIVEEFVRRATS